MKSKMVCHECGSTEVTVKGTLRWNDLDQKWVIEDFDDDTAECHSCDSRTDILEEVVE